MVERGAGRRGVRKLRAIVSGLDEPSFTRSEAERLLLEAVRAAGLGGNVIGLGGSQSL